MAVKLILEGLVLGAFLVALCVFGIRKGPVNMVYFYPPEVQERCISLGLTTREKIDRDQKRTGAIMWAGMLGMVLFFVYVVNGARGFRDGFLQTFIILEISNLIDRFGIDEYWVLHTDAWIIPGTEDLRPYIGKKEKTVKWLSGTLGMAVVAAVIAGIMSLLVK